MLQIQHLHKAYAASTVLTDVSFIINDREHVGLIGPNGVGKSTLLRCIVGLEQPDSGHIICSPQDMQIGYLAQSFDSFARLTVRDALAQAQAELVAAEHALAAAADALATATDMDAALAAYEAASAAFEALGGYSREARESSVLAGLGLGTLDPGQAIATLSGGQKTRLGLALLLFSEPGLLILDEPTNHLDLQALEWLESFVRDYPHAVLVVSHDRAFLDRTIRRTLYLDPATRSIRSYSGNYGDFAAARNHEQALHEEAWQKQQEYINKVEGDIARLKGQALGVELSTTPSQPSVRKVAKKVAKKAKSRERKLERFRESDQRVEKPRSSWGVKLDFGEPPASGRAVVRVEGLYFRYGDALPWLLANASFDVGYGERIAITGANGAGKTTLLKLLAGELTPTQGTIRLGSNARLGSMAQEQETLDANRTVLETIREARPLSETEARNFLHFFLFSGDSVFRLVGVCSLGERSRLQLALLVLRGCNLLLLDEPLNHLDIEGREHFEAALDAFEGTIIAISHDRTFLESFAERTLQIDGGSVTDHLG